MDIYDMLDTISEDTKARYITRIVDTGEAYVVEVCDVGGEPVFVPPYQYLLKVVFVNNGYSVRFFIVGPQLGEDFIPRNSYRTGNS